MPIKDLEAKRKYAREYARAWRERNRDKVEEGREAAAARTAAWRASRTAEELEAHRDSTREWRKKYKENDPDGFRKYERESHKKYRDALRRKTVAAYGGFCTCCGCNVYEFLTFDHMDGGGRQHKREERLSGVKWYYWLWNKGALQKRIRLNCYNCNCSRGFLGRCPHEQEQRAG